MIENSQEEVVLLDILQQPNSNTLNLENQPKNINTTSTIESQEALLELDGTHNQSEQEYKNGNTRDISYNGYENSAQDVSNDNLVGDSEHDNAEDLLLINSVSEEPDQGSEYAEDELLTELSQQEDKHIEPILYNAYVDL
jgi:hypothetical protein